MVEGTRESRPRMTFAVRSRVPYAQEEGKIKNQAGAMKEAAMQTVPCGRSVCFALALIFTTATGAVADTLHVWSLVNGERRAASQLGESWHVVTRPTWPETIAVQAEWRLRSKAWASKRAPYLCKNAMVSSENGSFQQQATIEPVVQPGESLLEYHRYLVSADGIQANWSISNPIVYTLSADCTSSDPHPDSNRKEEITHKTVVMVDANDTAGWKPVTTPPQFLSMVTPQEGAKLTGGFELKLQTTGEPPLKLEILIEKAGVVDVGTKGDLSLPDGQVYGSQWETILSQKFNWSGEDNVWVMRHGLAGPGLYALTVRSLDLYDPGTLQRSFQVLGTVDTKKATVATQHDKNVGRPGGMKDITLPQAKLSVKSVNVHPAPLKEGSPVNLEINFANTGNASSAADAQFKLTCTVLQGNPDCPVPSRTARIGEAIQPGQTTSVLLMGAKPAGVGQYRVTISPMPEQRGRPFAVMLNVTSSRIVPARPPISPPPQQPARRTRSSDPSRPPLVRPR